MTIEELEKKISVIEHDYANEIRFLKEKNFKLEVRFEALIRYLIWEGNLGAVTFTVDKYQQAVAAFLFFNNKVQEINKLPSINEKVEAASKFNENCKFSKIRIYGDDLGLRQIIENAGGTSGSTAVNIIGSLPCSQELTDYLQKFIIPVNATADNVVTFPDKKV